MYILYLHIILWPRRVRGVILAHRTGYTEIAIEGDNLIVIQALKGEGRISWQILNIIKDIQLSIRGDVQVTITHIFRETNMVADWLSKFGHSITDTFMTDLCFSLCLNQITADDFIGRTLMRRGV